MRLDAIEIRPEIKAQWLELAARESREFRADIEGKPRLHSASLPPTKAELMRSPSPWEFSVRHGPNERPLLKAITNYRDFRMVADPNAVVLHKH